MNLRPRWSFAASSPRATTSSRSTSRSRARGAVARLAKEGIIVDDRPGCVRVSPHFYNTPEEVEALVAGLHEVKRMFA